MEIPRKTSWLIPFIVVCSVLPVSADEIDDHLRTIEMTGRSGIGASQAKRAAAELAKSDITLLPKLLKALNTENLVAANWYRTVYEKLVREELAKSEPKIPVDTLRNYVRNPENRGRPRRLVLSLLDQIDPEFRGPFLLTQFNDEEFRTEAVSAVLRTGDEYVKSGDQAEAKKHFQQAFRSARNSGQIQTAASKLKSVGIDVDIIEHMGFVIDWYLIGPFDAPGKTGFETSFPPEKQVDLKAVYPGQRGEISWKRFQTENRMGELNLNQAIKPAKEAVGYAYTEFKSPSDLDVEIRCGADDNLSIWLNGEKVLARKQWLNGTRLDRFTAPVHFVQGKNRLLVKVCQGPQHKNPAVPNNWSMQLRICHPDGAGVKVSSLLPEMVKADSSQ